MTKNVRWLKEPEQQDYPAAESYLDLVCADARGLVNLLRHAKMTSFKAKDILRASRLTALGIENKHVEKDKKKIRAGRLLSPLLLVRDSRNHMVIVADGYHRLCAVYYYDEDADIPCKIVEG
jgi:hypothetical protein